MLQAPAWHARLALLGIRHTLVLDAAHTEHLRHQAVELIEAAPGPCSAHDARFAGCAQQDHPKSVQKTQEAISLDLFRPVLCPRTLQCT